MEDNHVLETAKDAGGSRVIEAFLSSGASGKQKRRLVTKYVLQLLLFIFILVLKKEKKVSMVTLCPSGRRSSVLSMKLLRNQ